MKAEAHDISINTKRASITIVNCEDQPRTYMRWMVKNEEDR